MTLVSNRFDRLDDAQATPALSLRMRLVLIALNITGWFIVSIGLTMYNKWMFYYSGFHFPLLVSSLHIAIKIPCAMAAMHLLGVPGLRLGRSRQTLQLGVTGCATALDIGQSMAVRERDVIAVEALEGSDRMIQRAGELCRTRGWTFLKTSRADHDTRADVPSVGVSTIESLAASGAGCMALGVGRVILIDRPEVLAAADAAGIAVVGVEAE